ncbi:MAG: bifunctional hydroxymethylpyrimidine kinase/phosphomethylpyrimidine kinase [Firmicutes bacterium]|nr:bifunctional hydroxymethylpyrimidine kinase/phosphomethylpyrimidine kinase [Bacillota bacterium]
MNVLQHRLARLLHALRGRRVGVLGDVMLDRFLWGTATRLSPEAAVPVVDFVQQSDCLGGAGNVAANLAALGARVELFGVVGNDEAGASLLRCVRGLGLNTRGLLTDPDRPTTLKTRIVARNQQVVRVDREVRTPLASALENRLIRGAQSALRRLDALVLSDYDKGTVTENVADRVLEAAQRQGVPVFVKPKWKRQFAYRGATLVVCNRAEAGFLVARALEDEEALHQAGRALLAHFACPAVVITRGEQGMDVFTQEERGRYHIPAISRDLLSYRNVGESPLRHHSAGRQVFDVTGAGDTVLATLALASAAGASVHEAAHLANLAAGIVVGKLGTATVTRGELRALLRELRS